LLGVSQVGWEFELAAEAEGLKVSFRTLLGVRK
jgi:hypothetical protein